MLSSIPEKPLLVFIANERDVSSGVGSLKYSGPNTTITALQNFYRDSRHVDSLI